MSDSPLVSILMTAFNRENYISEAIESVLASEFRDFELIIVDDSSTDNTVSIAKSFMKSDDRIKVFINENNLGDYFNRNKAASYARGKYLKYVDSDDMIYPHGLGVLVRAMEQFPDAAVGIISGINQDERPYPYLLQPSEAYHLNFYKTGIFNTGPTGLIFRTIRFREIGGFSGKRFIGDTEINLRLAARWPVVMVAASLVYWRNHVGQEYALGLSGTGYLELSLPMLEGELLNSVCPLNGKQVSDILKYYRKISARKVMNLALRQRQFAKSYQISKNFSLRAQDFFGAIFSPDKKYKSQ